MAQYRWLAFTEDGEVFGVLSKEQADNALEADCTVVDTVSGTYYHNDKPLPVTDFGLEDDEADDDIPGSGDDE